MNEDTGLICTLCFQKFIGKQQFVAHFKQVHSDELKKRGSPQQEYVESDWFLTGSNGVRGGTDLGGKKRDRPRGIQPILPETQPDDTQIMLPDVPDPQNHDGKRGFQKHGNEPKPSFRCPEAACVSVFASATEVLAHVRTHTLVCPIPPCTEKYNSTDLMARHIDQVHVKSKANGIVENGLKTQNSIVQKQTNLRTAEEEGLMEEKKDVSESEFFSVFVESVAGLMDDK